MDTEIAAMQNCHEQLNPLDTNTKVRVIQWLVSKYELYSQTTFINNNATKQSGNEVKVITDDVLEPANGETLVAVPLQTNKLENYDALADFFSATNPNLEWEKALVVATYLQVKNGLTEFTGFEINKELKNLGYASSNITTAFNGCMDRKPQLILQLRKDGKARQAKKKYKVSAEGIKYVNALLVKGNNEA
jgi:hypothetical protein